MTHDSFLDHNRQSLLSIYGQIRLAYELELLTNENLTIEEVDKQACLDTVLVHQLYGGIVEFPLPPHDDVDVETQHWANELYIIVLCEEGVRDGVLIRDGSKYCPTNISSFKHTKALGNYLSAKKSG
jgi:hypothetical protein